MASLSGKLAFYRNNESGITTVKKKPLVITGSPLEGVEYSQRMHDGKLVLEIWPDGKPEYPEPEEF